VRAKLGDDALAITEQTGVVLHEAMLSGTSRTAHFRFGSIRTRRSRDARNPEEAPAETVALSGFPKPTPFQEPTFSPPDRSPFASRNNQSSFARRRDQMSLSGPAFPFGDAVLPRTALASRAPPAPVSRSDGERQYTTVLGAGSSEIRTWFSRLRHYFRGQGGGRFTASCTGA
jgi:hypothetical protein